MLNIIVGRNFLRPIKQIRLLTRSHYIPTLKESIALYLEKPERLCSVWRNFLEWNPELFGVGNEKLIEKLKNKINKRAGGDINIEEDLMYDLYIYDQIQVHQIITNYLFRGHLSASIDPLNIIRSEAVPDCWQIPKKDTDSKMKCPFNKERRIILPDDSFIGGSETVLKLKDILIRLNRSFCGTIGIEFMNHTSVDVRQWVKRKFEEPAFVQSMHLPHTKQLILLRLIRAHCFEQFVSSKWPNEKQHGAVGCEILMPALETLIDFGSAHGAQSFVLGMTTTRARLNVLANVFRKPLQQIFVPFHHQTVEGVVLHDDDKYILGNNVKKVTSNQALPTEFAVLASTSNFVEAIDPLVSGKTMAEQLYTADDDGRRVWPIVIHGDDVISGQGIVLETFRMANQKCFGTKGTIHIVLTNQYNLPRDSKNSDAGSIYATNVAHATMAPVFHVNSQDPEAVVYCMKVAAEYRAKFKSDVVVDLICYQKYLPPEKSLPKDIVKKIDDERPILEKYTEKLVKEELATWFEIDNRIQKYNHLLEYSYSKAQKSSFKVNEWLDSPWKRFFEKKLQLVDPNTSLIPSLYKATVDNITSYRSDINTHPSILEQLTVHYTMAKENKITWHMAENLALAFMLQEGINVRMTGDNCEVGESIKRHHTRYSVDSNETRIPLRGMYKAQGYYTVCNSQSSEFANLGFEIGFSQTSPKSLVIWESTREDRTSLAQYMIDVFLAAGEGRWFRQTGLVCLIPHGMEGEGDSTSTGRPERFLQMCNDDYMNPITEMPLQLVKCNWIVANVTTPSNYFHILRRQMKVNFRKPLILFTHKRLFKNNIYSLREDFLNKNRIPESPWTKKLIDYVASLKKSYDERCYVAKKYVPPDYLWFYMTLKPENLQPTSVNDDSDSDL